MICKVRVSARHLNTYPHLIYIKNCGFFVGFLFIYINIYINNFLFFDFFVSFPHSPYIPLFINIIIIFKSNKTTNIRLLINSSITINDSKEHSISRK